VLRVLKDLKVLKDSRGKRVLLVLRVLKETKVKRV